MLLRFSNQAWESWESIVSFYADNYGSKAISDLTDRFEAKCESIRKFPESGSLEPLAYGLTPTYRFFYISKYLKVIYYIDNKEKSINVADIWDARMSPQKLRRRLNRRQRSWVPVVPDFLQLQKIYSALRDYYNKAEIDEILQRFVIVEQMVDYVGQTKDELRYTLEDHERRILALEEGTPSAIRQLTISNQTDSQVSFSGLTPNSSVQLFTVSGELLRSAATMSDGTATLNIDDLSAGIYVVRNENSSYKFIKK